jgi:hypothetical protein
MSQSSSTVLMIFEILVVLIQATTARVARSRTRSLQLAEPRSAFKGMRARSQLVLRMNHVSTLD